jgi:hypothetical protein
MRYFFHLDDDVPNNDLDGIELPLRRNGRSTIPLPESPEVV